MDGFFYLAPFFVVSMQNMYTKCMWHYFHTHAHMMHEKKPRASKTMYRESYAVFISYLKGFFFCTVMHIETTLRWQQMTSYRFTQVRSI